VSWPAAGDVGGQLDAAHVGRLGGSAHLLPMTTMVGGSVLGEEAVQESGEGDAQPGQRARLGGGPRLWHGTAVAAGRAGQPIELRNVAEIGATADNVAKE
jgi:hypothetical protein